MAVVNLLTERAPRSRLDRIEAPVGDSDPYGIDVQLSLYVCYELHYRGFAGVDPGWEWNPGLLHLRARLEDAFLGAVRRDVGDIDPDADVEADLLSAESSDGPTTGGGTAQYLRDRGTWQQIREYFVHRSLHHIKEGELFTELMVAADLDPTHLAYIDIVPAESLAVVNLISLLGLHRSHRAAAVGHLTAATLASRLESRRLLNGLVRLDSPHPSPRFYVKHLEANAVQEKFVRTDVVGELLDRDPARRADVVFGMRAFGALEDRLGRHLMDCWRAGHTSLRRPLD